MALGSTGSDEPAGADRPVVAVCDDRSDRADLVREVVAACGADVEPLAEFTASGTSVPSLAVVALNSAATSAGADLTAIRRATAAHIRVVAYGDGVDAWPLGVRCGILLA